MLTPKISATFQEAGREIFGKITWPRWCQGRQSETSVLLRCTRWCQSADAPATSAVFLPKRSIDLKRKKELRWRAPSQTVRSQSGVSQIWILPNQNGDSGVLLRTNATRRMTNERIRERWVGRSWCRVEWSCDYTEKRAKRAERREPDTGARVAAASGRLAGARLTWQQLTGNAFFTVGQENGLLHSSL